MRIALLCWLAASGGAIGSLVAELVGHAVGTYGYQLLSGGGAALAVLGYAVLVGDVDDDAPRAGDAA